MANLDLQQDTLFGKRTISSIGYDEQQIIKDILHLHGKGNYIDCDPTYSIGNFYKKGLPKPEYKFDINPQAKGVVAASADNLPLENETCKIIMFDPPFLIGNTGQCSNAKMSKRFSLFKTRTECLDFYRKSLAEFHRVLKHKGIVIFKNQDVICTDSHQLFTHCYIHQMAIEQGFYVKDLFILLAKQRLMNPEHIQAHARKFHSYYFVLEKGGKNVFKI